MNKTVDQKEIRSKVLQILKKKLPVFTDVAKDIGISADLFVNFLKGKDIDHESFLKIHAWIDENE